MEVRIVPPVLGARSPWSPEAVAREAEGIRGLARALLRDPDRAEDVVQDACVAALARPPREGVPLRPWLVRVVQNLAARAHRDDARRAQRNAHAATPSPPAPADEVLARAEQHGLLLDALTALPDPYRTVLLLRFLDGLPPRKIASRLAVPAALVSTQIHRGLALLRARLDAGHGGNRARTQRALALLAFPVRTLAPAPFAPVATGAVVMTTKPWAAALVLVLLAGGIGWGVLASLAPEAHPTAPDAPGAVGVGELAAAQRPPRAPGTDVPATADLASVDRALDLHGTVIDAEGHPIEGAQLTTITHPWAQTNVFNMIKRDLAVPGPTARSARDGTFRLRLAHGTVCDLRATADGRSTRTLCDCQAGERVRIVLGAGTSLVVEVVDERSAPITNASVRYFRDPRVGLERIDEHGKTDATGHVTFAGLPEGAFGNVEATHPDHGSTQWVRADTTAGTPAPVRIVLPTGRPVRGRVLDAADGHPIAAARVGLGWTLARAVTTDAEGRFELKGYTGMWYVGVCAAAPGYDASELVTAIPVNESLTIRLTPGAKVTGRVVDAQGHPIARALVGITGGASRANGIYGTADDEGHFTLTGVAKGMAHTIFLAAPGAARTLLDVDVPDEDETDLGDLKIDTPVLLTVVVPREDGTPAEGTTVAVVGWNADRDRLRGGLPSPDIGFQGTRRLHRTDDLGRAVFADLAPGTYEVEAQPLGARWVREQATLAAGGLGSDLRLRLIGSVPLTVHVVDDHGAPVGDAEVSATLDDDYSIGRTCDASGTARFVGDRAFKKVEVTFWSMTRPVLVPPERPVAPEEREITIVVAPAGIVKGRVLDLDGKPAPGVGLEVLQDGRALAQASAWSGGWVFSDPEGRFEVRMPPDTEVSLRMPPEVRAGPVIVGGGAEHVRSDAKDLVVRQRVARLDRSLTVHVTGPDGLPAADVQVFARVAGQDVAGANVRTDARGVARLERLPDVPVVVSAVAIATSPERATWARWDGPSSVPAGQTLEATLRGGRVLEGRVLDHEGKPVAHCLMSVVARAGLLASVTSDADGRYRMVIARDAVPPLRLSGSTDAAVGDRVLTEPEGTPADLQLAPPR